MKRDVSRVHLPHNKNTANCASVVCEPPKEVFIPLKMCSGRSELDCCVKVGDHVKVGTLLGTLSEGTFAPVHSSVSGTVKDIIPVLTNGAMVGSVVIESDGKMEVDECVKAPAEPANLDEFLECVKNSGCVGLGGAAYPTWGKLAAAQHGHIHTFLINGAECEPYLTSDNRTMIEDGEYIEKGINLLKKYLGTEHFKIGIESNKPEAIKGLKERFANDSAVEVVELSTLYPQGAKQVLLYNVTGEVQKPGTRLAELGVLIINVTSLVKMAQYFETGMPLVSRCVTVDGSMVKNPGNYVVPIGTPISYLFEQAGGFTEDPTKVIIGGPMMGHAVRDLDEPVVKATGGVVAFNEKEARIVEPSPCIHCGKCVDACPLSLNPTEFAKAMATDDLELRAEILKREQISLCMQCGCCSFVCPAHRPLVQTNIKANSYLRSLNKRR